MCTRYIAPDEADIEREWHIGRDNPPRWWEAKELFPHGVAPFIRSSESGRNRDLVVGHWSLLPFDKRYSTVNARREGIENRSTSRKPWANGQRCIIPAAAFFEPCWETGKNVWWKFLPTDGVPFGLAGIWTQAVNHQTGEILDCYSMITINADDHPLFRRMHKPDPKLPPDQQDKRSVVPIIPDDVDVWLRGSIERAETLLKAASAEYFEAVPMK